MRKTKYFIFNLNYYKLSITSVLLRFLNYFKILKEKEKGNSASIIVTGYRHGTIWNYSIFIIYI